MKTKQILLVVLLMLCGYLLPLVSYGQSGFNTFVNEYGLWSLPGYCTGVQNTCIGDVAFTNLCGGSYNAACGEQSMQFLTTGNNNSSLGEASLVNVYGGNNNTAIGSGAGHNSNTVNDNTFVGYNSGFTNASGSGYGWQNTCLGSTSDVGTTGLINATSIGYGAIVGMSNDITLGNHSVIELDFNGAFAPYYGGSYNSGLSGDVLVSQGSYVAPQWTSASSAVGAVAWLLTGNNGTTYGTNFIGTIGNTALMFKTNSEISGRIENSTNANENTSFGYEALNSLTSGADNVALGVYALKQDQNGYENVALGVQALNDNVGGYQNVAVGYQNSIHNSGSENVGVGYAVMGYTGCSANGNVGVGYFSLWDDETGANNVGIGIGSLAVVYDGNNDVAVGALSQGFLYGSDNVSMGFESMQSGLFSTNTGGQNVAIGSQSLYNVTTASDNCAIGYQSLYSNDAGDWNVALGYQPLYTNTTGGFNDAIGAQALYLNQGGSENEAMGWLALYNNTTGSNNIAIGYGSMVVNTAGSQNVAVGDLALNHSTATNNTGLGYEALNQNMGGHDNTALGYQAGFLTTSGNFNVAIGDASGATNATGSNNTTLGYDADVASSALSNATAIGYDAVVGASNDLVLGAITPNQVNVGIATTTPQQLLEVGTVNGTIRLDGMIPPTGTYNVSSVTSTYNLVFVNNTTGDLYALQNGTSCQNKVLTIDCSGDPIWDVAVTSGTAWQLTGNSGTTYGTNFVGNSDNVNLMFKINGVEAGRIEDATSPGGTSATALGYQSLLNNAGTGNTSLGFQSGLAVTTGVNNVGVGYESMTPYTATSSTITGQNNVGVGDYSYVPYYGAASGNDNIAMGYYSLDGAGSGSENISMGYESMYGDFAAVTGDNNIGLGYETFFLLEGGNNNIAMGNGSQYSIENGEGNVAIGSGTLESGFSSVAVNYNTAVGDHALTNYFTIGVNGQYNTALGASALEYDGGAFNAGSNNVAVGYQALYHDAGASNNTAVGYQALSSDVNGGVNNTVMGYKAGNITDEGDNTFIGFQAGISNQSVSTVGGNENTCLGSGADVSGTGVTNETSIGFGVANTTGPNTMQLGTPSMTYGIFGDAFIAASDGRFKKNITSNVAGLKFINKLKPVTYNFDDESLDAHIHGGKAVQHTQSDLDAMAAKDKIVYSGFVAQDVEAAAKSVGYNFSGVHTPYNDKDIYGLAYSDFVVPLVKAVQELSAQNNSKDSAVAQLQQQVSDLTTSNAAYETKFADQQSQLDQLSSMVSKLDIALSQCCTSYQSTTTTSSSQTGTTDAPLLNQNIPNPFTVNTVISCYVPTSAHGATISVFNLEGTLLKSFTIGNTGFNQITITGGTLAAGNYLYTLFVDGQKIDTKTMTLTH